MEVFIHYGKNKVESTPNSETQHLEKAGVRYSTSCILAVVPSLSYKTNIILKSLPFN